MSSELVVPPIATTARFDCCKLCLGTGALGFEEKPKQATLEEGFLW